MVMQKYDCQFELKWGINDILKSATVLSHGSLLYLWLDLCEIICTCLD